jgi:hypothetical protein
LLCIFENSKERIGEKTKDELEKPIIFQGKKSLNKN